MGITLIDYLIIILTAYLFGSIPSGYWLAKTKYNEELEIINGRMGTKYVLKNIGFKASFLTFLMDFSKGYIPIWTSLHIFPETHYIHASIIISIIIGHNYSIFLNFKGGKGIAASLGCFFHYPIMLPIMLISHYLANELCKTHTLYGLIPLSIVSFTTYDPYSYFTTVPIQIRFSATIIIMLFIIKTFDDPLFINEKNEGEILNYK